ncbi:MAG TPA: phage baseplate assembly protein [Xanthobacteraceae bacterium]|jgi:hypothetical protein
MHRATPANSSFRAYVSGGARATVNSVDDSKLMQEHASDFMINESRSAIESPQNYGFTSVVTDATKDAMGNVTGCAETFISFMGGNRSFPVAGNMDDRRHRLINLIKGDVAMFRQVADKLQFHLSGDGGFLTGPRDKVVRMQLLDEDSGQQQQQQPQSPQQRDASSGQSSSSSSSGGQQQKGQQARYKDAQKSYRFVHVTQDATEAGGTNVKLKLQDGNGYVHVASDQNVYLGAESSKAKFALVVTLAGPAKNTKAKI